MIGMFTMLVSCGDLNSPTGDGVNVIRCSSDTDIPFARKPLRMAMENSGNRLYVLDEFSGVSRWNRKSYGCGWELDRAWQSGGSLQLDGFAQELDLSSDGRLYVKSGSQLLVPNQDTCTAQSGSFAVSPSGATWVLASDFGAELWSFGANRCQESGNVPSFGAALTADFDDQGFVDVEATLTRPERLVGYSESGVNQWIEPLSVAQGIEPYLCSADRVRTSSSEIVILDKTCGKLATFDRSGRWIASIMLDSIGIRHSRVLDVSISSPGVAELLVDDAVLTTQVSWRALMASNY